MPTIQEIDAEIAKRDQMSAIDAEIAKREDVSAIPGGESFAGTQPESTFLDDAYGVVEAAKTFVTGATTGAVGFGIGSVEGAIGELLGNIERGKGVEVAKRYADALTDTPDTPEGMKIVKWVGDKLGVLPPVLGTPSATGLMGVGRIPIKSKSPEAAELKSFVSQGFEPKEFKTGKIFSDAQKKEQLNKALATGDKESLAAMIDADPEFFKAIKELDVKEKGLPSAASKNRQYQETEQALKKMPGSDLSKREFDQVSELQKISDDLITEFGGTTDKSELSMSLANDADRVIDNLNLTTEAAYNTIKDNIPKQTASSMDNIGAYMKQELADLGGDVTQLSPLERRLSSMSEKGATYHALDKIRKEVGATIGKKSDKYKSEDVGALKRIYSKLTDDQEIVANDLGMGDAWNGAKDLVIQRKALEDKSIQMFGKNLSDAFMPKMGLAMKKLTTGDYKKFSELMDAVPEGRKQEVVVSALNDVFTMGSRKEKQLNVAGYADWFNGLNKNAKLKSELYSHLPKKLTVKLDAMGKVTNGIRNAQAAAPVGGQVMAGAGVFDKVVNGVAQRFLTKLPGLIGDVISVGLEKSKTKGFDAAMGVLSDPDFIGNINALAKGQAKKAAHLEKKLMNKKTFRDFTATLSPKEAKAIGVLGLTSWLARSDEQQDQASAP